MSMGRTSDLMGDLPERYTVNDAIPTPIKTFCNPMNMIFFHASKPASSSLIFEITSGSPDLNLQTFTGSLKIREFIDYVVRRFCPAKQWSSRGDKRPRLLRFAGNFSCST